MPIDNANPKLTVVSYQPDHAKFTLKGVDMACVSLLFFLLSLVFARGWREGGGGRRATFGRARSLGKQGGSLALEGCNPSCPTIRRSLATACLLACLLACSKPPDARPYARRGDVIPRRSLERKVGRFERAQGGAARMGRGVGEARSNPTRGRGDPAGRAGESTASCSRLRLS